MVKDVFFLRCMIKERRKAWYDSRKRKLPLVAQRGKANEASSLKGGTPKGGADDEHEPLLGRLPC